MTIKTPLTLALDTAADSISVAVLKGTKILAHKYQRMERGQGEALIPMIQEVLSNSKLDFPDLERVAVSVGPGSFTGVRIGLATARGIGLALNIPVVGITSFEAAAYGTTGKVLVVLDTKRGDFFTQYFKDGKPLAEPVIRTPEKICAEKPSKIVGSGAGLLPDLPHANTGYEPACAVGLCSLSGGVSANPLYLRDADVSC